MEKLIRHAASGDVILEVRDLHIEFHNRGETQVAVEDFDLALHSGEIVGLVGESLLLATLPAGHDVLAASVLRFVAFDGAGLVLMGAAWACAIATARRPLGVQNT